MRLSPNEIKVIKEAILQLDPRAEIFLYGSRVHDHLKGGDIDLLVVSENLGFKDKLTLITEILFQLGEQKLDISIKSRSDLNSDEFFKRVLNQAIQIK